MSPTPHIALYLDIDLAKPHLAFLIERCLRLNADLLVLAPPPAALAVSRLEPHLGDLAEAGIEWRLLPVEKDPLATANSLTDLVMLACDSRSTLARRADGPRTLPLTILFDSPARRRPAAEPARSVDWLAPRLHRGF